MGSSTGRLGTEGLGGRVAGVRDPGVQLGREGRLGSTVCLESQESVSACQVSS